MTRQEVAKMFFMVKATYPRMFKDFGETETNNFIDAWCMVFNDIPAEQGYAGLKTYLSTETSGFPPSPGQIKDCIYRMTPDAIPNEMSAWSLVVKAVRNSNYNSVGEFDKLPQIVRRVVRDPARLREWANMDAATFQTVEQSNFMRCYRAEVENERVVNRIPQDLRPQLEHIPDIDLMIEDKQDHGKGETPDAEIENMINFLRGANNEQSNNSRKADERPDSEPGEGHDGDKADDSRRS